MKKSALLAALALAALLLSGCDNGSSSGVPESSEPTRSMEIESGLESTPESTEDSLQSTEDSAPDEIPSFPVQNEGKYVKTTRCYNGEGELTYTRTETFDEHDNVIIADYEAVKQFYAYEYNEDGTVAKNYYDIGYNVYEYKNGLKTKVTHYKNGELFCVDTYDYDEYGNETLYVYEYAALGASGATGGYVCEYEYDENGWWISKNCFNFFDNELLITNTCVRDENGNIISGVSEDYTERIYDTKCTYEMKYDENGNVAEWHYIDECGDGRVSEWRIVAEYDEQGREIREINYATEDGVEVLGSREEYEYAEI